MRRVAILGALAVIGCGGGSGGSVTSKFNKLADVVDDQIQIECDCANDDSDYCEGERELNPDYKRCFIDALEDDDHAGAYIDCTIAVERAYNKCISKDECNLDDEECLADYDEGYAECDEHVDIDTLDALLECEPDDVQGAQARLRLLR
ncbi:MAG: hypothetical protein ABW252_01650 [Polyangiales bacterium]